MGGGGGRGEGGGMGLDQKLIQQCMERFDSVKTITAASTILDCIGMLI